MEATTLHKKSGPATFCHVFGIARRLTFLSQRLVRLFAMLSGVWTLAPRCGEAGTKAPLLLLVNSFRLFCCNAANMSVGECLQKHHASQVIPIRYPIRCGIRPDNGISHALVTE